MYNTTCNKKGNSNYDLWLLITKYMRSIKNTENVVQ